MQIIQGIRDKGAAIVIGVIALSLIGFILMDAKQGSSRLFGSGSTEIGKVNGKTIEQPDFNKRVKMMEDVTAQRMGGSRPSGAQAAEIRQQVWDQIVMENIFMTEAGKLGIDFTGKEFSAILSSNDRENPLLQEKDLVDPATGRIDQAKVKDVINNIKKAKGDQLDYINAQLVDPQRINSISAKYYALLSSSAYYPSWMEEADKADNSNFATISYVGIPFGQISDSAVKVTDADIQAYVEKHKDQFKQEAGRRVSYLLFSEAPNNEDSARARDAVAALKAEFQSETNVNAFLLKNNSPYKYDSNYYPKAKLVTAFPDSIASLPVGGVFGPYVDKKYYMLARNMGVKAMPDSVKARHILLSSTDPQTGQPIAPDSVIKKRADSILAAINSGANFGELVKKYSDDPGSKEKGGEYTFAQGAMVAEFNDFCFNKPVGTKGIVKTQYGYHIIEVMSQKGSNPSYRVAYMGREITASETTINAANLAATKASAEKEAKRLNEYIKKNGLKKVSPNTIVKENDSRIGELEDARQMVRWAFDAHVGDVSEPFNIGEQFVVGVLDKIEKEGLQDVETARPMAEAAVREEKKAAEIIKKLGANPTLESAAAAFGKEIMTAGADSSITFNALTIPNVGNEPKLIGACFNKENQSKVSAPIIGKTGVYLVKVNGIAAKTPLTAEKQAAALEQMKGTLRNQATTGFFDDLKKRASIKDNRSKFY